MKNDMNATSESPSSPPGSTRPSLDLPDYQELRYLAGRAEYLRTSIRRAVWVSSFITAVLTLTLAFGLAAVTGSLQRDQRTALLVEEHREQACEANVKLAKLILKAPGTPRTTRLPNCSALPDTRYRIYHE
jgi:hypothetical protein